MNLMVSGRTDIVAFYTPWFMNRIKEGYFLVHNTFNYNEVYRINYEDVDLIMFCTKNPIPIIPYLKDIKKPYVFHVTLTPYNKDIEPNVIDKKLIIKAIKDLSKIMDKEYLYVRYDPIIINQHYSIAYHIKAFNKLCSELDGYVKHIIISFVDVYKNVIKNNYILNVKQLDNHDYEEIANNLYQIANNHHMTIQTCYETIDLTKYGFLNEPCLSPDLANKLTGKKSPLWQARKCSCASMVDIGVYNTCLHLCKYCYANYQEEDTKNNNNNHNPHSPFLIGELEANDIIKIRKK